MSLSILHLVASYKPAFIYGGPVVSVSRLCESISIINKVTVYTTTANGEEELDVPVNLTQDVDGVSVYYFKRITKGHSHFSPALLCALWRSVKQFDIVHIHSWWNLVSVLSALICIFRGVKPILSPRGALSVYSFKKSKSSVKKWLHVFLGKHILRNTYLHATTHKEWEECKELLPNWNGFVLPNYLPYEMEAMLEKPVSFARNQEHNPFQILFVGRLHPVKGIELLFNALAKLEFPFKLILVGGGEEDYENELKKQANNVGIASYLYWKGFLQGKEKIEAYQQSDILVLPSYTENFGMVLVEAWTNGLPTVVTKGVGLSSFVKDHQLGWVADHTPESLANAIIASKKQNTKRLSIASNAQKIVCQQFSSAKLTEKYLKAYHQFKMS
ncbi:Glycosyltransferase involved in cell wall bisynthesis [Algoriphagus faecimaris]|uniref:Glycosyltransferase involved in cell wall bisynthesis n=1 Tax=Algoriphagus faecimaris TaxID=686796 RepID=A0A1G6UDE2_9BACT|nr:glycosyltransferase [Algoriphagus faecimaris]SDD38607.1 Glycosyltransferase involved in cell wall bisynthesis [Algoriphagus faecimaris]